MAYSAARRTLASAVTRSLSSTTSTCSNSRSRFAFALLNRKQAQLVPDSVNIPTRFKHSGSGYSPLNDATPNWSNRPPKETILLDGCDYEHWLIILEFNDPKPSEEDMINSYVKTLAAVVGRYPFLQFGLFHFFFLSILFFDYFTIGVLLVLGFSEEEAKKKIYSVSTSTYTGFGALISEELSLKVKGNGCWVLCLRV